MDSEEYSDEESCSAVHGTMQETDTETNEEVTEKSERRYEGMYENFIKWAEDKSKPNEFSEQLLLQYFKDISLTKAPPSLWSSYSMLKTMLNIKNKVNISKYTSVTDFIKMKNKNYVPVKSKVFTDDEIAKFINEAPDYIYLATKVVLIFGLLGGCKVDELVDMNLKQIETHGRVYIVKVRNSGTKTYRSFTISDEYFDIVEKYLKLRPVNLKSDRFFTNYQKGKCTMQFIGRNKFAGMPKQVAKYLKLEDVDRYTGYSIRRTSATLYANAGVRKYRRSRKTTVKSVPKPSIDQLSSDNSNSESSSSIGNNYTKATDTSSKAADTSSASNNVTEYTEDCRLELINKYFTFENCTNVHINFK